MNNNLNRYILTADIGGSHITASVYDIETRTLLPDTMTRHDVYCKGSIEMILEAWFAAFALAINRSGVKICGVALAMPGPFDYENGISYIRGLSKYEALYGKDIRQIIAAKLGMGAGNVRFRNDAESAVAGEALIGAGKNFRKIMGVTLGTGFGSALHCDDQTVDMNLGTEAFKHSIADDYLSTRWFVKRYFEISGLSVTGVKDIALLAEINKTARDVFKEFAINMSDFLMDPIMKNGPEALIICGNIAKASPLFLPQVRKRLSSIPIRLSELGEEASLIGAASLFPSSGATVRMVSLEDDIS